MGTLIHYTKFEPPEAKTSAAVREQAGGLKKLKKAKMSNFFYQNR